MNASFRHFVRGAFSQGGVTVAVVSPRPELHEALKNALSRDERYKYVGVRGKLSDVGPRFGASSKTTIVIADLHDALEGAIAAIDSLRSGGFGGPVIALSDGLDESAVRGLLRLRVTDWLRSDADIAEITEACGRALRTQRGGDKETTAKCIAFLPAAGGVGTTTIAIQTGFLIGKRLGDFSRTCLVDLNFQSGSLADYLDLEPLFDIDAITADPARLDAQLLELMLARHSSGLAVLAGPRVPTQPPRADGKLVTSALSIVADTFEHMVLDLPPVWEPWTLDVLAGSDQLYVVTEFTVPAMRKARELAEAIAGRLNSGPSPKIIVSKFRQQLFGGLRKADATRLLGDNLGGFVPEDYEMISEAINRGEFDGAIDWSSRVSRELARIVLPQ